jgi:HD-GYP domain-containing protein (c-di-GMP phosphodiesterase class II)
MPTLAPVVALEHHRRLDGTGYPDTCHATLNLATQLCSVGDVYDAMRSQRAYQQAFPTERILAIYKRQEGAHFDRHLIRRFVQLIGIYPPGNLVKLSTDEIAVVLRVHAPDPYRPKVKIVLDADGTQLPRPREANLWETVGGERDVSVVAPLDPDDYGIDPLALVDQA